MSRSTIPLHPEPRHAEPRHTGLPTSPTLVGPRRLVVPGHAEGRLDKALVPLCPDLSRARLQQLIAQGCLRGPEGTITDGAKLVKPGADYWLDVPAPQAAEPEGQDIPLVILFEDDDLIVIDKPAGLVVHPAAGNPDQTLVNALIHHCGDGLRGIGGEKRPGIVHRLDKDTSGVLVAAKTEQCHRALSALFASHDIERHYRALVWGALQPRTGTIHGAIGRSPKDRKKMAIVTQGGKAATTHYRVEQVLAQGRACLVECQLETGRTHQIRVHLTSLGHPLIGDPVYGRNGAERRAALPVDLRQALQGFQRQALHAAILGFRHPRSGQLLRFETEMPHDMQNLLLALAGA